jgi:opacity protein-like surface antigen
VVCSKRQEFTYMKPILVGMTLALAVIVSQSAAMADGLPQRQSRIGAPFVEPAGVSWTGAYVGGGVGVFAGLTGLEVDKDVLDAGNWGYLGDVRVGYDYQFKGGAVVVGAFTGYSFGKANADINIGEEVLSASLVPTWNIGVRAGIAAGNSLIYTGYKYSQADVKAGGVDDTIEGHTILGGIELMAFRPISLAMEYGYTQYDKVRVDGVDAQPEAHTVMLRGNIRFSTP